MQSKFLAIILAGVLAGCGGGGDGPAESGAPTLEGAVVKGPVLGATLCAYAIDNGAKGAQIRLVAAEGDNGRISGGCYVTGADGSYRVGLPAGTSGDVLLEAEGGRFCSNERAIANGACAGGGTVVTLDDTPMRTVVAVQAGGAARAYVTPLSTAALANTPGRITASAFGQAFTTLAGRVIGPNAGVTPSTAPTAANQPYLAQVGSYLAGGGTLATAVSTLAKGTTTFTPPGGATQPATVNADFVGTLDLVFKVGGGDGCAGTGCSYKDGDKVRLVVHGDGRLTLPSGKVLSKPFNRIYGTTPNLHEIIWADAEAKIEYALSDNTGSFNEVNIGDLGRPTPNGLPRFLGQLRVASNDSLSALTAHAGTYPLAFQYSGAAVAWTSVTIGTDGAISFGGGAGPAIKPTDIVEVFDRVGCCGRIDVQVDRDLNTPANGKDGSDKISLHLDEKGKLRSISYDLKDANNINDDTGVRVGTVAALTHSGAAIPAGRVVNGTVDGKAQNLAVSSSSSVNTMGMTLVAGGDGTDPYWMLQLATGTLAEGSYSCDAATVTVQARLSAGAFPFTTRNGGRCTVTITRLEASGSAVSVLEGRFVAEMFDGGRQNIAPKVVRNGVFRWTPPAP